MNLRSILPQDAKMTYLNVKLSIPRNSVSNVTLCFA